MYDLAGISVASAGDVNGDGFDGGDGTIELNSSAGEAAVIFGEPSGFANVDIGAMSPSQGFRIFGVNAGDTLGQSVSSAGDINGDGYDDLVTGAPGGNNHTGEAVILFGRDFQDNVVIL